ncbi:transposase (plasmid) [Leptolyngbya sp. NIES-3755]|nr:transposase [Leptolyngbya sp. NIES-3755]BAU11887.1 transposase [Leptolyngbya sp. NIES-3755]BAU13810.1 transposase [Leptolyngbya sp. NIES-3755]BAU14363.1 transposase [Leptolyngbya sp. NIES-3755]BAU15718.1 transposase [Leptolyngbya sp. NIES-3755]
MPCTPKKTVEQIIDRGNDYVIAVKKNQPKLYEWIATQFEQHPADSIADDIEHTRNRTTQRTVSVLKPLPGLDAAWVGVQRLIRVERTGIRGAEPVHETMFYFSSLATDAEELSRRVREHWHIENRLHYPKDVVMREDIAPLCDGYAPANFAILRTIALNLFRLHGFASITKGIRHLAHNISHLFSFLQ